MPRYDLTNQKFGSIKVLYEDINRPKKGTRRYWWCKCNKGHEFSLATSTLTSPSLSRKKCKKCLSKNPKYNLLGHQFGDLTVIKSVTKNNKKFWLVKCKCGNKKLYITTSLTRKNGIKHCQRCAVWTGYKEISGTYWTRIQQSAKKRNLRFNLKIEYVWDLFEKQNRKCALSGVDINFYSKYNRNCKKQKASLDRINSKKGYIKGNVQWVHKDINFMKQSKSNEEFIIYANLITKIHPRNV